MVYFSNIGYLGRLGNQMFQFSSALGISIKLGYRVAFPIENCDTTKPKGPIDPKTGFPSSTKCDLLDCFDIPRPYFKPSSEITPATIYKEKDFKFNPEVLTLSPRTDLYGYFQNQEYFKENRDLILSIFKFKTHFEKIARDFISEIGLKFDKVSLHVRRGDYTLFPAHHPVCSMDYYSTAMKKFESEDTKFLIFSDDIDWCRSQFKGDKFIFVDTGSPYSDLAIMVQCDHNIIANSSFSWWGAWLNTKIDKKVIAPSRWFGPAINKDASEIYCDVWEKI